MKVDFGGDHDMITDSIQGLDEGLVRGMIGGF